jgi:hypothetical protein
VIDFELDDDQDVFSSATVTGPGLPQGGLQFFSNENRWELNMDESLMACARPGANGCMEPVWNSYELTDAAIDSMPNICTYTVTFNFEGGGQEVHTVTKPAKPLNSTQLSAAYFPTLHNLSQSQLTLEYAESNLLGDTTTFTYSTPSAFTPVYAGLEGWFNYSQNFEWNEIENWLDGIPLGSNQSQAMTLSDLPEGASLWSGDIDIYSGDTLWREYNTNYKFRGH